MPYQSRKSGQVSDKMYMLNTAISNFYIYDTGESLIALDTGMGAGLSRAQLDKHGLDPGRVSAVFLTHSDFDHVGGLSLFPNAGLYLSVVEEDMVTHKRHRQLILFNRRLHRGYSLLRDREKVAIGGSEVELIYAPGHTPGSSCYFVDDTYLITGDLLTVKRDGSLGPFNAFNNMNHKEDKKSLERLSGEGVFERAKYILPGHGGYRVI